MTAVHSPFPAGCALDDARAIEKAKPIMSDTLHLRDSYPALPWSMEELVGSEWRNLYTGSRSTIIRVGTDRWERSVLVEDDRVLPVPPDGEVVLSLGLWWKTADGREMYVVENEIRVDVLPPDLQFVYALRDVEHLMANIPQKGEKRWQLDDLAFVRAYAQSLAQKFGLLLPEGMSNIGRSGQLLLF